MSRNLDWAQAIIDTLCKQGVKQFFLSPGTRSAPLALALASHSQAQTTIHFDERGLCFHALGYAKAKKTPVAVVVTSGTAVGNLLPALMEADQSQIPLIILTADRPPEQQDIGANQTCDQIKLFTPFVRYQTSLPNPDLDSMNYLTSTIQQAVFMSQGDLKGPVHINCAFKDPRAEKRTTPIQETHSPSCERGKLILQESTVKKWAQKLSSSKKGVILMGDGCEEIEPYATLLAETLGWPIFADLFSSVKPSSSLISHYDLILQSHPDLSIDGFIQFGNRFVSRTLYQWLSKQTLDYALYVTEHPRRQDPHHLISDRLQGCPRTFLRDLIPKISMNPSMEQIKWKNHQEQCNKIIPSFFHKNPQLSEPRLALELSSLHEEGWALFIGNSLPVRDCNALFTRGHRAPLFGNRGVSGIDGNIATALGIAKAIHMPMISFLGDFTSLHDLNSLALLNQSTSPFVICISNNQGGGIFSSLPFAKHTEHLDPFFTHSHSWDFSHAAALFHIPYLKMNNTHELSAFFRMQREKPQTYLIEVCTEIQQNLSIRTQLLEHLCLTNSCEESLLLPL